MGRNKLPVIETPEINEEAIAEDMEIHSRMTAIQAAYTEERDLVNQLLGQVQMASATGKFFRTFGISKLAYVKENKLYRALSGKKTPNGSEFLNGTWEEFCELLGMSPDKADLDIANLRAFGEEALENMGRIGIGYRELRQYRRLPADQQTALIEAAKINDKETFLDLAEELIAKHAKEKESLSKQADEDKATLAAKDKVIKQKAEALSRSQEEAEKLRAKLTQQHEKQDPDTRLQMLRESCNVAEIDIESGIINLRTALQAVIDHSPEQKQFAIGIISQAERSFVICKSELGLDAPLAYTNTTPYWQTDEAQAIVTAETERIESEMIIRHANNETN